MMLVNPHYTPDNDTMIGIQTTITAFAAVSIHAAGMRVGKEWKLSLWYLTRIVLFESIQLI